MRKRAVSVFLLSLAVISAVVFLVISRRPTGPEYRNEDGAVDQPPDGKTSNPNEVDRKEKAPVDYRDPFSAIDYGLMEGDRIKDLTHKVEAEMLREDGLVHIESYTDRYFRKEAGHLKLPRFQINLHVRNLKGKVVPLATLGSGSFGWITDKYSFEEYKNRPDIDGVRNQLGFNLFVSCGTPDEQKEWGRSQGIVFSGSQAYRKPYGVQSISAPVLPLEFDRRFPELSKHKKQINRFGYFLRAGEWYELSVFVYHKYWTGMESTIDPERDSGTFVTTYIRAPKAENLKIGKVIVLNHVITKDEPSPIGFTNKHTKDMIKKGLHVTPRYREVDVKLDKEIFKGESSLKCWHYNNIKADGLYSVEKVSVSEPSCSFRVRDDRPGGVAISSADQPTKILMSLTNIQERTSVILPNDADYVMKDPIVCNVTLSPDLENSLGGEYSSFLYTAVDDEAPVAWHTSREKYKFSSKLPRFLVNEGDYYIRFRSGDSIVCPGRIVIRRDKQQVRIEKLSKSDSAKWQKYLNR